MPVEEKCESLKGEYHLEKNEPPDSCMKTSKLVKLQLSATLH
jgi:hypothetical protein